MGRRKSIEDAELLACARAAFLSGGALVSVRDVAKRAGISEAAVFKRYPTKTELFLKAMLPPDHLFAEIVRDSAASEADAHLALVGIAQRLLEAFRQVVPAALHLSLNPSVGMEPVANHFGPERMGRVMNAISGFIETQCARGRMSTDDPKVAAQMLIAAVHSLAVYEVMGLHSGTDFSAAIPSFVDQLWSGLAPEAIS